MDRITVKLGRDTHARLMVTLPELSTRAGRMLTITEGIDYLLANWDLTKGQQHIIRLDPAGLPEVASSGTS